MFIMKIGILSFLSLNKGVNEQKYHKLFIFFLNFVLYLLKKMKKDQIFDRKTRNRFDLGRVVVKPVV